MVGNITFLMIFAVFDPSLLTLGINCSFLVLMCIIFHHFVSVCAYDLEVTHLLNPYVIKSWIE